MSILLVDIGNSRIKWSLNLDGQALAQGAHPLIEPDTFGAAMRKRSKPDRVLACNVAGAPGERALHAAIKQWQLVPQWIKASQRAFGVSNCYPFPETLGPDRWAALVAAHAMGLGDTLVISLGTAMTVDWLRANGDFAGGMIIPGLSLMRAALAQGTSGVGHRQGKAGGLACNTADAVETGLAFALAGAVRQAREAVMDADGQAPVCLVTGGDGEWLASLLEFPVNVVPDLVLQGLALIADGND